MSLHRVNQLLKGFGKRGYVDVLKDTPLEQHGKDHGFGLYVVRGVLDRDVQDSWAADCYCMFEQKSREPGGTKPSLMNVPASTTMRALLSMLLPSYMRVGITECAKCC